MRCPSNIHSSWVSLIGSPHNQRVVPKFSFFSKIQNPWSKKSILNEISYYLQVDIDQFESQPSILLLADKTFLQVYVCPFRSFAFVLYRGTHFFKKQFSCTSSELLFSIFKDILFSHYLAHTYSAWEINMKLAITYLLLVTLSSTQ